MRICGVAPPPPAPLSVATDFLRPRYSTSPM
nr:MAG TPA: hypothetical protein [Caudoviricetes sp.]